jgi:monooxygenase
MNAEHLDVLIIGAGISGIGTACRLTTEFPGRSFALLERRQRLGGTWDLFRYPGIRSDIDMLTLGYAFRPWRDPNVMADGPSIRQYLADTAAEYGVDEKIRYGLKIVGADWSSAERRWTVTAQREATGETCRYTCGFLVNCTGYYDYDAGYRPTFPGVDEFKGKCVHPQHWPEVLNYTGKKVVVIGSGATAVTLVPAMAGEAEHVTMLQRSPSYVLSLPMFDKISATLDKFLPHDFVYSLARKRNILVQRRLYLAGRRWPRLMRSVLLRHMQQRLGPTFDMRHFTPRYLPFDERLCMASNGDLFEVLASGAASVVTDEIETFTETGILLKSGHELEADVVVTATGLNLQFMGGMKLSVDGATKDLHDLMMYKGVLIEGMPNFAWFIGYTNAAWTLKADIAASYLCRLFQHMDANGYTVATPRDLENCETDGRMMGDLHSGYVERGMHLMPRNGSKPPWQVLMHYEKDRRMLLKDPVEDGVLEFETTPVRATASA